MDIGVCLTSIYLTFCVYRGKDSIQKERLVALGMKFFGPLGIVLGLIQFLVHAHSS